MEVDSGRDCGIIDVVGEHMEFCSNGVCSELRLGNILGMVAEDCAPLQKPDTPPTLNSASTAQTAQVN